MLTLLLSCGSNSVGVGVGGGTCLFHVGLNKIISELQMLTDRKQFDKNVIKYISPQTIRKIVIIGFCIRLNS